MKLCGLIKCSDDALTKLVSAIKHKTLEELDLSEIHLTSAVAESLGQSLPELSAVRTLKVSGLIECSDEVATRLGAVIKHKTLEELDLSDIHLTSAVAESLPELSALRTLNVSGLIECSDDAVTRLVAAIKHKTLEKLELGEINPMSAAAVALGQSLSELPSLQNLKISGSDGCNLQLELLVLRELKISGVTEFSADAVTRMIDVAKHKPLEKVELSEIHLTSALAEALGQLLSELLALQTLKISGVAECSDDAVTKLVTAITHKSLEELELCEMNLNSTVAGSLSRSLPKLSALQTWKVSGLIECSDDAVTRLIAAIKPKTLKKLDLSDIHLTSAVAESLPELSALRTLNVSGLIECSDDAVTRLVAAIKHKTLEKLELGEINPMSAAAVALGQSLSELPSLQNLKISGSDGCNLQFEFSVLREVKISGVTEFSAEAVTRLINVIKNKPFEKLNLSEINVTSAVAEALGQLLHELSALERLEISGLTEWSDGAGTRFFAALKHKTLKELDLNEINVTSSTTEALGQLKLTW